MFYNFVHQTLTDLPVEPTEGNIYVGPACDETSPYDWPIGDAPTYINCPNGSVDVPTMLRCLSTVAVGDRVRIREGYEEAGKVGFYASKSVRNDGLVCVVFDAGDWDKHYLLAAAIESYPYTREERIERAIEDYVNVMRYLDDNQELHMMLDHHNLLFAIIDAGV